MENSKKNHASHVVKMANHASAANLGLIMHHADNLGPIMCHRKPFATLLLVKV